MKAKKAKPQEAKGLENFIWIFPLTLHICPLNGKVEFYVIFQRLA